MTVNGTTFMRFILAWYIFLENSCSEFHQNRRMWKNESRNAFTPIREIWLSLGWFFMGLRCFINFCTEFVYQISSKSENSCENLRQKFHLRPSQKYDSHWADFHDICWINFCRKFVDQISWKSDELITDMSRPGGQVKYPCKTSYSAYTPPIQNDNLPFPTTWPSRSKFVHPTLRTYLLILVREQSWTSIKLLTMYTSLQFATSYAAGPPENAFVPSFHPPPPASWSMHVLHHSCGSPRLADSFSFKSSFI